MTFDFSTKISNNTINKHNRHKFAFVGAGNMASALISGILNTGLVIESDIIIFDVDKSKYNQPDFHGVNFATSLAEAISGSMVVFLSVKPNILPTLLSDIKAVKQDFPFQNQIFVSISASVPISFISKKLGSDTPIIRMMPSITMSVGHGTLAITANDVVISQFKDDYKNLLTLFSKFSKVLQTGEENLNNVIAVNGSSPAYVFLFIKAMLNASLSLGFSREEALPLILQTIFGAVKMIEQSNLNLDKLISAVAVPGGTTEAALKSLLDDDFEGAILRAMQACTDKADNISLDFENAPFIDK